MQIKKNDDKNNISNINFSIADNAKERIINLLQKQEDEDVFLRVMIEEGGCAGTRYHIIYDDYFSENDVLFFDGDKKIVVVDKYSMEILNGGTLFLEETLEASTLKIKSDNFKSNCSCGSSFSV